MSSPSGYDDSGLRHQLSRLEDDCGELRSDLDALASEFGDRTGDYDRVGTLERDLRDAVDQLEDLDDLRREVKSLTARLAWVEQRARSDSDAPVAALEADARLRQLARTAQQRHHLRDGLLNEPQILRFTTLIARHDTVRANRDTQRAAALAASARVEDTTYGTPEHRDAIREFRTAYAAYQTARTTLADGHAQAADARQALARDTAEQTRRGPKIDAADQAWTQLQTRLRTQLNEAVGQAAILPRWFLGALGPMPPADDPERWIATAVDALAYRATYAVTDPVLPLGPESDGADDLERQAWRSRLQSALRRLRD